MRPGSSLLLALATALLAYAAGPARAADDPQDLCGRLFVPAEGYRETCTTVRDGQGTRAEVTVTPEAGPGTATDRLTLRALDQGSDPLAWDDPQRWLERRVEFDLSALTTALRGTASDPNGLLGGPAARAVIDGVVATLDSWSRAPLTACTPGSLSESRTELYCSWGLGTYRAVLKQRLIAVGERRYALAWRGVDGQDLRHLEAVANSFQPP